MKMEECTIVCRLEVAEHRALLDKIQLSENLATSDKNSVSIARATITIYVPRLPYPAPPSTSDSFSCRPRQSPSLHTPPQLAAVQPAAEVNSYVQSCTRHTLPSAVVTATGRPGRTGSTAAGRQCGNADGASVELSHTLVDNNNNNNNSDDKLKDNRELLRKIAENYRTLNRRDVSKRPATNYSVVSRRVITRIVHKHKTEGNVLPANTQDNKMTTPTVNEETAITSSKLRVSIDRSRLGDRLNALLDNGTFQPSTSTSAAVNNINTQKQEETARNSSDSSTTSPACSTASSSSLEQYLKKRYDRYRAKGKCFDTYIMTRHQRELLQQQEDCALMTEEEELRPVGHRKSSNTIKMRMSSKMKKKQALLATFAKNANNGESVKVSPPSPQSSSSSSDSESSSARKKTSRHLASTLSTLFDTESSSSSDIETATVQSSENAVPATAAFVVKRKIRAVPSETLARYLAHMREKQRINLDTSATTTIAKDEEPAISTGDGVLAGGELLETGNVSSGGRTVSVKYSTETHTSSDSDSVSGKTGVAVVETVQCNSGNASRATTRKPTRIQRKQRFGRRFFHHNTIPYIKPRKRVQLRKTFSASLANLVDKSIEISKHKGTSKMNNNAEQSITTKLRNTRKAKTPKRKVVNGPQDGNSRPSIAEEDAHSAPGAGSSTSASADTVAYKGYSICNKLNVNSTQENGQQRDTDNKNNSPGYTVTQSDNATFAVEYKPGEIKQDTAVNQASSNTDDDSATSHNDNSRVEKNNVTSNDSARKSSEDEAHTTNAQPASDTAQQATGKLIISNVRSIAACSNDEATSNTNSGVSQPQDSAGISVIPEYLLQSREPADPYSTPTLAVPSSSTNSNTGGSEQNQVQPSNDGERLQGINRRLHIVHHTPNNRNEATKLNAQTRPKRTYTRRQKPNTETGEAMFRQYQQLQQQNQQQLSLCLGMQVQPEPPAPGDMYQLSPNGRHMLPIHQYQTREPPSYRSTVNNMINPNVPRLSMAARQSMNAPIPPAPAPPPPPPLLAYPAHITNPMIHSPPPYPMAPPSHVNPMPSTAALPPNIDPMAYRYPISIVPPSTQTAPRAGAVRDEDMYKIRPMHVLEHQQYTPIPPSAQQIASRASVQSPPTYVHSAAAQRQVQQRTVQSPIEREAQSTFKPVLTQHTVENMIRPSVQSPSHVAARRNTVQAQVHPPLAQRVQQNQTPASTSTERVIVEHLPYAPIEDIVNKVVQSLSVAQDRIQSPAAPEDRVPSATSEHNVVQYVAEDTVKLPAEYKLLTLVRSLSGSKVVQLVQPVTRVTVTKTSEVKVARQEANVHSSTIVEALTAMVSAINDRGDENIDNQQVITIDSEETLPASDSETITLEEVHNIVAGQSSTVCNTSTPVEQSKSNNNDVVVPATVPHVDTPRARPRIRNRPRAGRYWHTPSAVRSRRTIRAKRIVNRQNYRRRRRIEHRTLVISHRDTTTTQRCEVKKEQTTETSSVPNNTIVPSTSRTDRHQTPDRMNVPVNFYSQTDEPPVYVSTVISQGIEALSLAQMYLETFQNNHDTMRELQQALRELIANVNGENADSRISHTEHLLKQVLRNQRNIRTEFVIQQEVMASQNGTQQSNNPQEIFTLQRLQEVLEKLAVVLTQLHDSAASTHSQQRTSEEQPSIEQRDTINDEPIVNLQMPWFRAKNFVVDNSQPSTSREVSTVSTTPSPQDDVKYTYALGKLEERKLDHNKRTLQRWPTVNTHEELEIVTELLDSDVTIQCSIPVHTAADQNVQPDEENSNVPSVTSQDTSANNTPQASSEVHLDRLARSAPPTDIPSQQSTISGLASGIVGPSCQICCSSAKHAEAKRNAQKTSTVTSNEQSNANQEQQQQQHQPTLTTANQHQPTSQSMQSKLTTAMQQQQQLQQLTSEKTKPTLITVNQQQQPVQQPMVQQQTISQPMEQQQPIRQPIDWTLMNANQQQQQLAIAQPIKSAVTDPRAVSTYSSRPIQLTEHIQIPCTIDIPPILRTDNGHRPVMIRQPTIVVNRSQILTTLDEVPLAIESEDNTSHRPAQSAIESLQDIVSVIPSPSTHLPAPSERRTSDGERLLSSAANETEEYQDARTQSSTSASQSNKRHVKDTPTKDDGSKRARLEPSTSDIASPASVAGQSVPPTDFMAAMHQRLENTEILIRTLINKKDRKRGTGTATAVRDEELASQSSVTSMYTERTQSRSTSYIHRPPETPHYNPPLSHHHQRQRHHPPTQPPYNVPTYQRPVYSTQPAGRPQSYYAEHYPRQRSAATPFQEPVRVPSRYYTYPLVSHPGLPLSANVPVHSHVQPQPSEYSLPNLEDDHLRRRSEPLPHYIPLPRRTNMDMTPPPPPPPPSSRHVLNHHEYRSRRSSHRSNPSASSTAIQPNQQLYSDFMNYVHRNNLNINNGTDSNTTMYPVVQVPPFPAEVLHGKQYNTLLCKYYQEPNSLMKHPIKSKHTNTKYDKQRTDYNNIITSIGDKNTVIQAKRYPHSCDHMQHLPQQIHDTQCDSNKTYIPPSENNKKQPQPAVVVGKQNNRQPVSDHLGAKHAIELAGARLQVEQLNSFIENNRRMLLRDHEPCIRPETLSKYAVTDAREIHRLFDAVALMNSDQYYRSLWCMWSVAENKHLYEFYRTVTQLQIRAGQIPFAIRIFIELLRCKYFGSVRKFTEDQCKR